MYANDFDIAHAEAQLLWGKSKKQVQWAIDRDKLKWRQALNTNQYFISFKSCVRLWGEPTAIALVEEIMGVSHE